MAFQLAITAALHPSSISNLVNVKSTGAGVKSDFPVGLLLQLSEVSVEDIIRNFTSHDLGLLIICDVITPENRSELELSTRRGTMMTVIEEWVVKS
jgi:hypothetical protein